MCGRVGVRVGVRACVYACACGCVCVCVSPINEFQRDSSQTIAWDIFHLF